MSVRQLTPLRIISSPEPRSAQTTTEIYRPFFLAGILTVLTAGCTLGAIALLGIALKGSYTTDVWTPYVLAHANSQLYGWVGFFIIGFALQQHAPRHSKVRLFHLMAYSSLTLMAVGIGLRFAAEPLVSSNPALWRPLGVLSGILQFIAVLLFITNMQVTRPHSDEPLPWQGRFVLLSLAWMLVISLAEPIYFAQAHQSEPLKGILFVAEYFPPYRDAQFLGFVTLMIFGVALTKMHSCFGAKSAHRTLALYGLALWNIGLLVRMAGWVSYFRNGMEPGSEAAYVIGGVILAFSAVGLVVALRIFEPLSTKNHSHKFIRAAFAWLLVGGAMLVLEPVHLRATELSFSHAYLGGMRHALTVGFITQMILGVGMHVVARMNDIPESAQKTLWASFVLINVGNAARVCLEVASDYTPKSFTPMGFTGFIELTGLAIWAFYVVKPMLIAQRKPTLLKKLNGTTL